MGVLNFCILLLKDFKIFSIDRNRKFNQSVYEAANIILLLHSYSVVRQ
jgi:hypothetical protein